MKFTDTMHQIDPTEYTHWPPRLLNGLPAWTTSAKKNEEAEQGVALNTCPAASSIRHDHSTFNQ
jgi:hypothetical protein